MFLVADGTPVVIKPSTMPVAIDLLMKSFFVLNLHFPRQTAVVHNFLQHTLIAMPSKLRAKALKLHGELM